MTAPITVRGSCIVTHEAFFANRFFSSDPAVMRDNCNDMFAQLRRQLLALGIELNTEDITPPETADFVLQIDAVPDAYMPRPGQLAYLFLAEPEVIQRRNFDPVYHAPYSRILTWNDALVDGDRYRLCRLAQDLTTDFGPLDYAARRFCVMFAAPKWSGDPLSLYGERIAFARWMMRHAPDAFDLYGPDWPASMRPPLPYPIERRMPARVRTALDAFFPRNPTVRGIAESKRATMQRYRFSIAYENSRDTPGYVSEKIFDSMCAGCVPVYWGASNITDLVPADCFIDRRRFRDTPQLVDFLHAVTPEDFAQYQLRIRDYLASPAAAPFRGSYFGRTIAQQIASDVAGDTMAGVTSAPIAT